MTVASILQSKTPGIWYFPWRYSKVDTVPFRSIRQYRITGPLKLPKCNRGNGQFWKVLNTLAGPTPYTPIFRASRGHLLNVLCSVTVTWPKCQNQNFSRCVMCNRTCRIDRNGRVTSDFQRRVDIWQMSLHRVPREFWEVWAIVSK